MNHPLITVIMPAWNAVSSIQSALESIADQEMPLLEVIVVDDGSEDGTAEMAAAHPLKPRVHRQQNGGPPAARNTGLELAKGEWITFLDVDDLWPSHSLAQRAAVLAERPELKFVVGRVQFERHDERPAPPVAWTAPNLGSGLYRRQVFQEIGTFDPTLRYVDDVDWFWRARDAGVPSFRLDEVTLIYRRHDKGLTFGKSWVEMGLPEVIRRSLVRGRSGLVAREGRRS